MEAGQPPKTSWGGTRRIGGMRDLVGRTARDQTAVKLLPPAGHRAIFSSRGPVFRPPGTGGYSNQHSDPIRELLYSDSSPSSSLRSWEPIAEDPSGSHDRLGPTYGAYDALCEKRCFMSPLTTYCRIPSGRLKYPCSHARTSYAEYAYHLEYVGVGERTKSEENPNLVKITEVVTHGFPTSTHSTVLIDIYSPMGRRCRRNLTKLRILCGVEAPNM